MALDKPQVILTHSIKGMLVATFRYTKEGEKAFVLSLLWKCKNNPIAFFKKITHQLEKDDIECLESVVQKSNLYSIRFHKKLGFEPIAEYDKAIRFTANVDDLKFGRI